MKRDSIGATRCGSDARAPRDPAAMGSEWIDSFAMREDFTSYAFLAMACIGVCAVGAGTVMLVLTMASS
jgi:ferredoxin